MRWHDLLDSRAPAVTVLIRIAVGTIFLSEGIQKFLYVDALGAGRFAGIGFPAPEFFAALVGVTEIAAGALVLVGLFTRLASSALLAIMVVALITTKLPILLGQDLGPFVVRNLGRYGFWSMAHEARTDWSMLLGSLFLVLVGGGRWSVDAKLARPATGARAPAGRGRERT